MSRRTSSRSTSSTASWRRRSRATARTRSRSSGRTAWFAPSRARPRAARPPRGSASTPARTNTPRTGRRGGAAAGRLGFELREYQRPVDEPTGAPEEMTPYFDKLFAMKPGEVMPFKWRAKGEGYWLTWVDTVTTAGVPTWEKARARAIAAYRMGGGGRALDRTR